MSNRSVLISIFFSLFIFASCSTENKKMYTLETSVTPQEAGNILPASGEFDDGTELQLTVSPNENWIFDRWSGDGSGSQIQMNLKMTSNKNVTAQFIKREYPLTVEIEGEGFVSEKIVQQKTTDYEEGTMVELTAEPADEWIFIGWAGDIEGDENPQTILIEEAKSVTAIFERKQYELTVEVAGQGSVMEKVVQQKSNYEGGTLVELSAIAEDGWVFSEWQGDLTGDKNPETLLIEEAKLVTAVFEKDFFELTIQTEGDGSVATQLNSGSESGGLYEFGSQLTLTATAANDWAFVNWIGDASGDENPLNIEIGTENNITAFFDLRGISFSTSVEGEGTVTETLISGSESVDGYLEGSEVELTANPETGWEFVRWEGDLTGSTNPESIIVNQEKEVTAVFERKTFTITTPESTNGSISISPVKDFYPFEDEITVTAVADENYTFDRWTEGLGGRTNPRTIRVTQDLIIQADFVTPVAGLVYQRGNVGTESGVVTSASLNLINNLPDTVELTKIVLKNLDGDPVKENNSGATIFTGGAITYSITFEDGPTTSVFNDYTIEWTFTYKSNSYVKINRVGDSESFSKIKLSNVQMIYDTIDH